MDPLRIVARYLSAKVPAKERDTKALIKEIQRVLTPDLLKKEWRGSPDYL